MKNHRPPRRSIRPFLPCQQVSVKVVPTRSTTPRKERTPGKSSCEHESKGHQPLHSIKCLLLECYFGGIYLFSYLGSVVSLIVLLPFFLFLHVFAAFCCYYFLVFPLFLLFCLSRVPAFAALCCLPLVLLLLFL